MNRSKNKYAGMDIDEKRALLADSIKQLNGHPGFEAFLDALYNLREYAVRMAVSEDSVGNEGKTLAALGEIRAYEDIFALVEEQIKG